jgi:vacuolar-type H+-ATPase subunit I/STV1
LASKVCKGCGVEKDLREFYAAARNLDGRMGKCKSCVKGSVRENRRNRRQQYAEYERSRANLQHRVEARRKYQEEHKEEIAEYKKTWQRPMLLEWPLSNANTTSAIAKTS